MIDTAAQIEAFLFSEGGSLTKKRLLQLTSSTAEELEAALKQLSERLSGHGLMLVVSDLEVALVMTPESGLRVQEARGKELNKDIGDAGLEVLAIVLYRGPSTRAQIDFIRGVNTATTVRNLMARGLLVRTGNPSDGREYLYRATTELLAHLGQGRVEDMPEYATISRELANFENSQESKNSHATATDSMHDERSL
jgi:segregation and condensation protein B